MFLILTHRECDNPSNKKMWTVWYVCQIDGFATREEAKHKLAYHGVQDGRYWIVEVETDRPITPKRTVVVKATVEAI